MEIVTSWIDIGIERGVELGKQNEARCLVFRMLRRRLGSLRPEVETRIAELPVEQLKELAEALLNFSAQSDLTGWLDAHAGK